MLWLETKKVRKQILKRWIQLFSLNNRQVDQLGTDNEISGRSDEWFSKNLKTEPVRCFCRYPHVRILSLSIVQKQEIIFFIILVFSVHSIRCAELNLALFWSFHAIKAATKTMPVEFEKSAENKQKFHRNRWWSNEIQNWLRNNSYFLWTMFTSSQEIYYWWRLEA